jgi:hypothetical protein
MPYLLSHFKAPAIRSANPDIATHLSVGNVSFRFEYSSKRNEIQFRVRPGPDSRSRLGKFASSVKYLSLDGLRRVYKLKEY